MRSPNAIITRGVVALVSAMATLSACSDDAPAPTDPGDPPTAVVVAFCTGPQPVWVAFQDGDEAWTRAEPEVVGAITNYRHAFTTNRGAVATTHLFADGLTALSIQYGAPGELAMVGNADPERCGPATASTLLGTVASLDTNEVAVVSAGRFVREVAFPLEGNEYRLRGLEPGPQDLLATRVTRVGGDLTLTGMILRRGLDLPDGATIPVLDFHSPEVFQPEVRNLTLVGLGTDIALVQTGFSTARSEHVVTFLTDFVTTATRPYVAIPDARLEPGDLQSLTVSTAPTGAETFRRVAAMYFRAPVDRTLALGGPPSIPELGVVSSAPTLRLRARFSTQADYDRLTAITMQQEDRTVVTVAMTSAYATASASGYDLVVPELTGVAGFDPQWALRPGLLVIWTASRIGGTLGPGPNAVPVEGSTRRAATDVGTFTP